MRQRNNLFPVFLRLNALHVLVVGGGNVGLEKLSAIFKNSPDAKVTVVAASVRPEIVQLSRKKKIKLRRRSFQEKDLVGIDLLLLATNNREVNVRIRRLARQRKLLVNAADTPDLCDFYLGSVVTKGDLKIGISTNGKSPTMSRRMREYLEAAIPDATQELLDNMTAIRKKLKGDLASKVKTLNEVTATWLKTVNSEQDTGIK